MAHMDVVEAKRERLEAPTRSSSARRTAISTAAAPATTRAASSRRSLALLKLKAAGFKPNRDIILFFTGDEETKMQRRASWARPNGAS